MGFIGRLFGRPESAEEIADAIVIIAAKHAFFHIRQKKFRRLLDLDALSKDKQFEIKLELELSGVALAYLTLESLEQYVEYEKTKESLRTLRNHLIPAFLRYTKQDYAENPIKDTVIQVLAQRCEDCREIFKIRKAKYTPEDLQRNFWPEISAISCLNYLLADQPPSDKDQEIFDYLASWNVHLAQAIERTILKRARVIKPA